jgi:hypothetical protein
MKDEIIDATIMFIDVLTMILIVIGVGIISFWPMIVICIIVGIVDNPNIWWGVFTLLLGFIQVWWVCVIIKLEIFNK